MQELALSYLDAFLVDAGPDGLCVSLDPASPEELKQLILTAVGSLEPASLAQAFEALSLIASTEDPFFAEVDEKVCPAHIYFAILDGLGQLVS